MAERERRRRKLLGEREMEEEIPPVGTGGHSSGGSFSLGLARR